MNKEDTPLSPTIHKITRVLKALKLGQRPNIYFMLYHSTLQSLSHLISTIDP